IASSFGIIAIMIFGKAILIPLAFALLLAFILFPLVKRFERKGMGVIVATFLSMFITALVLAAGIFLFSTQIIGLCQEFAAFQDELVTICADVTTYINSNIKVIDNLERDDLNIQVKAGLTEAAGMLAKQTVSGTAASLTGLVSTVIYTFLNLIFRSGLTQAF